MTFSLKGTGSASTANSTTANQASLVVTTATTAGAAGDLAVLFYAVDNNQTTDGDEVAVTAVTDSGGNQWQKAVEFTNGQGTAQTGAVCGIWYSNLSAAISIGGTVTLTFSNATSRDASAASLFYYTKAADSNASLVKTATLANDAAAAGSLDVTTSGGLQLLLRVRGIASESNSVTALTATAGFNLITQSVAVIALDTSMGIRGEYIITTSTSAASAPTAGAGAVDNASVYAAFTEVPVMAPWELSCPPSMVKRGLPAHQQQFTTFRSLAATRVSMGWFAPLSEPVRKVKAAKKVDLFPFTAARTSAIAWLVPLSEPVRRIIKTALLADDGLFAAPFTPPVVVLDMDWLTPLSTPVPAKRGLHPSLQDVTADVYPTTEVVTVDKWFDGLDVPTRAKQRAIADYAFAPLAISEVVTIDKWFNPLAPPQNAKRGLNTALQVADATEYFLDASNANAGQWFGSFAEPLRVKSRFTALQAVFTIGYSPETIGQWFNPLSEPARTKRSLNAPDQSWVPFVTTETVTVDKWFDAFSEPVRVQSRFSALQQAYTSGYVSFEIVTVDKWFDPLSEPVRTRPALRAALQPAVTQDAKLFPDPTNFLEGWFTPYSDPVRQLQGLKAGLQSFYANSWVLETVTVDKWFDALSEPVRTKPALRVALQQVTTQDTVFIPNPSRYLEGWSSGLAEPVRQRLGLNTALQSVYTTGYFSFEIITVDKWYASLSDPKRFRPALHVSLQQTITQDTVLIPNPSRYEGWYGALSEPQRQQPGLKAAQQTPYFSSYVTTTAEVITVDKWFSSLSNPTKPKPGDYDHYKGENEFTAIAANMKWFAPLTEPAKPKSGLAIANQAAFFAPSTVIAGEIITVDKWFKSYADPVRAKHPADDRYQGENNWEAIAASMEWFAPFTEPVRFKPGLVPATRPPFFASPAVIIIPSLASWWRPLAEPPKPKVSLSTHLQLAFTQDPKLFPDPTRFLEGWYNWFSEPVRHLAQLNAALQRSWTASDRRPVLATITVTMDATEINDDVALFAVKVLAGNPPATAVVSLTEIGHGASLTSIVEEGDDGSGTSIVES